MTVSISIGRTPNYATVNIGSLRLEFSYETVIAFNDGVDRAVRQNDWGPTTGKHLNRIDGGSEQAKKERLPGEEFRQRLAATLKRHGLDR